jgi:uncharacterized membrane protein YfcA
MFTTQEILFVVFTFILAGFVHGYAGVGFGIVSITLLSFLSQHMLSVSIVVSIGALAVLVVLLLLSRTNARVDWLKLGLLLVGVAIGQPGGYWFISTFGDQILFRLVLGAVLLYFAINGIVSPSLRQGIPNIAAVGIGLASGFIGGAFISGGPLVVMYFYSQADEPREMKATIQLTFMCTISYRLILTGLAGDYSPEILKMAAVAIPVTLPFIAAGHYLSKRGSALRFRQYVYSLIGLFGVFILARSMWTWMALA